ncbi:MAG TPA: OsmC family protein [Bacteroidia bacterium]|nr:OsmC family protein [Bacteroidia bacterium]QQR95591.1 MAG: OsmC family protein [Bacteroidota bacterium]MBP7714920.1 OsmC family protein [Bacteroidia bacterium]MBP8668264.1 OsmC family protein [Bacteroidia bacterium]HOZ81877.1 OsmC family protein [Bacteroidia bacterium]
MEKVKSHIGKENYKVIIESQSGNILIADEPVENGGKNLGLSPFELIAAALSACTSITVRMYADRKDWSLTDVNTDISVNWDKANNKTIIQRKIKFSGNLSDEQKNRLLQIANVCPVHKVLTNSILINTEIF